MLLIKSSHNFSKSRPKSSSFYFESMFSLIPKSHHTFGGILFKKICHKEISKIAQSGRTGQQLQSKKARPKQTSNVSKRRSIEFHRDVAAKKFELQKLQLTSSVTSKKSPNVCKSCTKMTSHVYKKIPYSVGNFAKLVVARGFKKLLKVH